jgi:hypothetical protein
MTSPPRYVFIHVMKTGGTSFVFHLLRQFAPDAVYPSAAIDRRDATDAEPYASLPRLRGLTPERKAAIQVFSGHFPFLARDIVGGDPITLTLLREPVDRTVSVLKQFKRLYERYRDLSLDAIYDDPFVFRHFVENHQTKLFSVTADDEPKMLASRLDFEEFHTYLTAMPGGADDLGAFDLAADTSSDTITIDAGRMTRAKENLAKVDVVGLNERFDEFVEALRARFGWWPDGMAGDARANVSSEAWDAGPALRARIARDNPFDVELYGYARELAS